jgi:PAS domain S-box-containing protein
MTKARVLVVEDEGVVALALRRCLESLGHEVTGSVATGEDAIRRAREIEPDIILMDIRLKGAMDGIQTAERILSTMKIPVIYLTAYSDEETLKRARSTDPFGFLLKPFDESAVRSAIEMTLHKAVSQTSMQNSLDRMSAILKGLPESVVVVDYKGTITFVNAKAETLLGVSSRHAVGKHVGQLVRLSDAATGAPESLPVSRPLLEKEMVLLSGLVLTRDDGSRIDVDVNISPLRDGADAVTGAALTLHQRPGRN